MSDRPRERFRASSLRLGSGRSRQSAESTLPGVRFPIVDDLAMIAADDRLLDLIVLGPSDLAEPSSESGAIGDDDDGPIFGEGSLAPLLSSACAWRRWVMTSICW